MAKIYYCLAIRPYIVMKEYQTYFQPKLSFKAGLHLFQYLDIPHLNLR